MATDAALQFDPDRQQIHVWCAFLDDIKDELLLGRYRELLTPDERRQQGRFYFEHDRHRYLVTRALVRTTLSRYLDVRPQDLVFITNKYGKPQVANDVEGAATLSFNITHAHRLVVLVVGNHGALGVDVESTLVRRFPPDVAIRYFAPDEAADVAQLVDEVQQRRMFEYWTLKESYIKARGMGLSIPLDQFSFAGSRGGVVRLTMTPELDDSPEDWRFWQVELREEYLAALCAKRAGVSAPELVVRDVVPMKSERALGYRLVSATSDA